MYKRDDTDRIENAISLFRRAAIEADSVSGIAAIEWHKLEWKYVADWMDIQLKQAKEMNHEPTES